MKISQLLNQGVQAHTRRDFSTAESCYRQILEKNPDHPDAIHFLGVLAHNVGRYDIAKQYIERAIELLPSNDACYNNMGNLYQDMKQYEQAVRWYEKAIQLNPDNEKAHNNMGVACTKLNEFDTAKLFLHKALEKNPAYAEAVNNLGEVCRHLNEFEAAMEWFDTALQINPGYAEPLFNKALILLLLGRFSEGWKAYESRWHRPGAAVRLFDAGQSWQGEDLNGRTIFVYEEQGMGDTLQFIRFLPMLKQLGANVIFETLPQMVRLLTGFDGFDRLWVGIKGRDTRPVDRFDFHVPLMSLPRMFGIQLDTIPGPVPYLSSPPGLPEIWGRRIRCPDKLKIGLVWAGSPLHKNDHNRSVRLSLFRSLKTVQSCCWISLQKEKYEQWTDIDPSTVIDIDLGPQLSDFADTAAVLAHIDLVICVDTAIVHLASAMGKEVWLLLPFSPDWRWLTGRDDSPWYPQLRLFRQTQPNDWTCVFNRLEKQLQVFTEKENQ